MPIKCFADPSYQVKSILVSLAKNVHANEKGCVKYHVLEQRGNDADRPDMILIEELRRPIPPALSFEAAADDFGARD